MRKVARYLIMIGAGFAILLIAIFTLYAVVVELAAINKTILKQFMEGRMGRMFFASVTLTKEGTADQIRNIILILDLAFNALLALSIWTFIVPYSTMNNLASKKHMILNIIVGLTGNIFCLAGGICGLIGMKQAPKQEVQAEPVPEVAQEVEGE